MPDAFFDTNILIDWLLDRQPAIAELRRHLRPRISRVVWTEVLAGEPDKSRVEVENLLRPFEIVELDQRIARAAVDIRHSSRIKLLGAFILATAQINGGVLITRDTKAFPPGTPGVHIPYAL